MRRGKDCMMPTKDELLFDNQSLKEDQEILLKRAREAEQARKQMQAKSQLLRAEIKEAQTEKEQAEALAEQLQRKLSQSPQPEEMTFLKVRLREASQALAKQKTLEERVTRLETARERDRSEVKEALTLVVENQIIQSAAIRALSPAKSWPPPQEKTVTPPIVSPYLIRHKQTKVKECELTTQKTNAVAEKALAWTNGESAREQHEQLEREIALMAERSRRYREIFLIITFLTVGLVILLGQTRFIILLLLTEASLLCGLGRRVFRSVVLLATKWNEESSLIWALTKAAVCGALLSLLAWSSLGLLALGGSLTAGNKNLSILTLWGLMILYVLSGAWTKSLCKAIYSTLT
jgi:hypothetical protein